MGGQSAPTTRQQEEALWTDDTSVDVLSLSPGHPAPISTGHRQSGHRAGTGVTPGANHMDPPTQATTGGPLCQKQSPEPAPRRPPRGPTSPSPSKALSCPQRTCRRGLWALPVLPSRPLPGPPSEPRDQCCIQPGHGPQLPPALPRTYPEAAGLWEGLVALRWGGGVRGTALCGVGKPAEALSTRTKWEQRHHSPPHNPGPCWSGSICSQDASTRDARWAHRAGPQLFMKRGLGASAGKKAPITKDRLGCCCPEGQGGLRPA